MRKLFVLLGLATSAAGVYVLTRAQEIANEEGRPLVDVLIEMPSRLVRDLGTVPDDLREAADEGRGAAEEAAEEFDEELGDTEPRWRDG